MNRDEVLGEWRRAARTLAAADLLVREGYPEDAVARAYYAILHAAKAALSVHDVIAESHASVRGMFGKHLIRTGAIERTWSKQLAASLDDRLAADYDAATFFSDCGKLDANADRHARSSDGFDGTCSPAGSLTTN